MIQFYLSADWSTVDWLRVSWLASIIFQVLIGWIAQVWGFIGAAFWFQTSYCTSSNIDLVPRLLSIAKNPFADWRNNKPSAVRTFIQSQGLFRAVVVELRHRDLTARVLIQLATSFYYFPRPSFETDKKLSRTHSLSQGATKSSKKIISSLVQSYDLIDQSTKGRIFLWCWKIYF